MNRAGEWTSMDPFSGNAAIGYARLNVPDGQKIMWEKPWSKADLESRPHVSGVELGLGTDCLRGVWLEEQKAVIATLKALDDLPEDAQVRFAVGGLTEGSWGI